MNNIQKMKWSDIKWQDVESRLFRIQKRIFIASKAENKKRVQFLQNIILKSLDAKLLSVRKVTTDTSGRHTLGTKSLPPWRLRHPGGFEAPPPRMTPRVSTTPEQKMRLVQSLEIDGKATPKPGRTEKRLVGISTIKDRAKQQLVLLALEPEWEAKREPNSYSVRPGRTRWDAIEAIFRSLRSTGGENDTPKYVLEGCLLRCFDTIDPEYLVATLDSTFKITEQVKAWVTAGIFEDALTDDSSVLPIGSDTSQSGDIAPFLVHIVLHGMENHLNKWILTQTVCYPPGCRHWNYSANKVKGISLIRYNGDFLLIHREKRIVLAAQEELSRLFRATHKVELDETKTVLRVSTEGIAFLGFSIVNIFRNGTMRVKIYPSVKAQKNIRQKVTETCKKMRACTAYDLIQAMRPKIISWGNYYRFCECSEVFSNVDYSIYQVLRKWVFRRDKRSGAEVVKEKYFPKGKSYVYHGRTHKDQWVLNGETKHRITGELVPAHLPKLSWIPSEKYVSVKGEKSVYDSDLTYWLNRSKKHAGYSLRQRTLFLRQKGVCPQCKTPIRSLNVHVDHVIPKAKGGKDEYSNLQLLHIHCHVLKTAKDSKKIKS
jgi:retron-type reverse transcriptase/5-methylcytosine-specific restriction endonuclease McrA